MNSLIVKLFVFITEVLSTIVIGIILLTGLVMIFKGNTWTGISIALGGTIFFVAIFGFAAIFNEIYKDIRIIRKIMENKEGFVNSQQKEITLGEAGECPTCKAVVKMTADNCHSCGALFGGPDTLKPTKL